MNHGFELKRKEALFIISRYFKFLTPLKKQVLKEMIEEDLLEIKDRYTLRIKNKEISAKIDPNLIGKIMSRESGIGR